MTGHGMRKYIHHYLRLLLGGRGQVSLATYRKPAAK